MYILISTLGMWKKTKLNSGLILENSADCVSPIIIINIIGHTCVSPVIDNNNMGHAVGRR